MTSVERTAQALSSCGRCDEKKFSIALEIRANRAKDARMTGEATNSLSACPRNLSYTATFSLSMNGQAL